MLGSELCVTVTFWGQLCVQVWVPCTLCGRRSCGYNCGCIAPCMVGAVVVVSVGTLHRVRYT